MLLSAGTFIFTSTQSCTAVASSRLGVAVIKRMLLSGINSASRTYSDKNAFMKNDLIIKALPNSLQSVFNTLEKVSPNTAQKGKEQIADAAAQTVNFSTPILRNAVNDLNSNDIQRIMQGSSATQILREKTQTQLFSALQPIVTNKLNENGATRLLGTAVQQGSNIIGNLFGQNQNAPQTQENQLSNLVTQQMVNGIFLLIERYEKQNRPANL